MRNHRSANCTNSCSTHASSNEPSLATGLLLLVLGYMSILVTVLLVVGRIRWSTVPTWCAVMSASARSTITWTATILSAVAWSLTVPTVSAVVAARLIMAIAVIAAGWRT